MVKIAKKDMTEICHNIANELLSKYLFKTISGKRDDEIYVYIDGVYEKTGKDVIKTEVEHHLGSLCKTYYVNEVINKIARKSYIKRENLRCKNDDLICVKNGVLDIKKLKLYEHSPDYNFTNKILVEYNIKSHCPKFLEFLEDCMYENDIITTQEWFGYCLYRRYPIKKAVICKGLKNTGKTQWMNILREFLGGNNVANKSLQRLTEGKWQIASLYNKYANVSDELSERAINDVNIFKELTGDSVVDGEIKFGDSFSFRNYAKLTFAANKIPYIGVGDDDEAYFERWIIFEFDKKFEDDNPQTKMEIWRDITESKEEMSGILNWVLVGLKRLLEKEKFSDKRKWIEIRDIMKKENPVYGFVKDCCKEKIGVKISKSNLYEKYKDYCWLTNKSALYEIWKFGIELKKHCDYLK